MCFSAHCTPRWHELLHPSPNPLRPPPMAMPVLTCCTPLLMSTSTGGRRRDCDVLSLERRLSRTSLAAQSQVSSATVAPAEHEAAEAEADPQAPQAGDGGEQGYSPEALEAAAQTLAELLPGSVPTPRLQPPEVGFPKR